MLSQFALSALALLLRSFKWAFSFMSGYMLFNFYQFEKQHGFQIYLFPFLFSIIASLIFGWLAFLSKNAELRITQSADELNVRGLIVRLKQGKEKSFLLYLRAFDTTNNLGTLNTQIKPMFSGTPSSVLREDFIDIERTLKVASSRYGKFITLGRLGEHLAGAARIQTTEEQWQQDLMELANASKLIFCIPSANAGTRWEINHIKKYNLFNKTVFIMPPISKRFDVALSWKNASMVLSGDGIKLPAYQEKGCAFQVDITGQVAVIWPIDIQKPETLQKVLREVTRQR